MALQLLLSVILYLISNCEAVGISGVCDATFFNCQCGPQPGQTFQLRIKQCVYFHRWKSDCKPCDKIKEDETCKPFLTCQECSSEIRDRCVVCPPNKYGLWCKSDCPCQNGGRCHQETGACECPENFEGIHCEKRKVSTCGPPETPPNGNIVGFVGEEGTSITYTCNEGFAIVGTVTRTCINNGGWTGSLPQCVPLCPYPTLPSEVVGTNNTDLNTKPKDNNGNEIVRQITFSCNKGLQIIGNKKLTCVGPGQWDKTPPICVAACQKPQIPARGIVELAEIVGGNRDDIPPEILKSISENDFVRVNTRSLFSCQSRYYALKGPTVRVCQENGQWSGTQPTCVSVCGRSPGLKRPVIHNGNVSEVGQWPWHVGIAVKVPQHLGNWLIACGGSLVNERWLLTAAHCVTFKDTSRIKPIEDYKLYFGKHFRDDSLDDQDVQTRMVTSIKIHPNYHPQSLDSDIALMEFSTPVQFTNRVQSVCLPDPQEVNVDVLLKEGSSGVVTGWGLTERNTVSQVLQEASLPVINNKFCEAEFQSTNVTITITGNMYCAGYAEGKIGACAGDSGGPMTFETGEEPDKKHVILGVVSWGGFEECARPHQYSGFTKVDKFLSWINQFI